MKESRKNNDATNWINARWHIDDVREVRPDLTDDQCRKVLQAVKRNHDANIGINWDVLTIWARQLYPEADNRPGIE